MLLSASIVFVRTNEEWAKPKPLYKQKERTNRFVAETFSLFCWYKVILLAMLAVVFYSP